MLTLTHDAEEAIQALTMNGPAECGVRISTDLAEPRDGGAPAVTMAVAAEPTSGDEIIETSGARLFLEPVAAQLLGDQVLDALVDHEAQEVGFFLT